MIVVIDYKNGASDLYGYTIEGDHEKIFVGHIELFREYLSDLEYARLDVTEALGRFTMKREMFEKLKNKYKTQ